jgi:TonB family protein
MKANVDFPKRAKNSFIYFQVGLIATMLVVLFILEFNFKDGSKPLVFVPSIEIKSEPTFVYNPAPVTKKIETAKLVVVKVPKVTQFFKPTKEEPKKEKDANPIAAQDNPSDNQNNNNTTAVDVPKDNGNGVVEAPNVFSVEQLPMFESCKGLDRADQKACFDAQLAKAVSKHLNYPESDIESGRQGVAQVEFVIDENGAITNVKALDNKRATIEMQLAAEKAVKRIPKLIPAKQGNKAVKIKYSIPVVFRMK